jgi:hypothetical protein
MSQSAAESHLTALLAHPSVEALLAAAAKASANGVRAAIASSPDKCREALALLNHLGERHEVCGYVLQTLNSLGWTLTADDEARATRRQAIRDAADALAAGGWRPGERTKKQWLLLTLRNKTDLETLEWIEGKGVFAEERGALASPGRQSALLGSVNVEMDGLIATLAARRPREKAFFERLRRDGVVGATEGAFFGVAELALKGHWAHAQDLVDAGEPPTFARRGRRSGGWDMGVIEEFLQWRAGRLHLPSAGRLSEERDALTPDERQKEADDALAGLRRLASWGAVFRAEQDDGGKTPGSLPFRLLLGSGNPQHAPGATHEMLETVGPELLKMGADLNDGDALALHFVEAFKSHLKDAMDVAANPGKRSAAKATQNYSCAVEEHARWAIERGLDMRSRAGALHARNGWSPRPADPAPFWKTLERIEGWGAKVSDIAPVGPTPVHDCLRWQHFDMAWALVERGAPFAYVHDGEGPLHALAGYANGAGLKALKTALARPEAAALVNQASSAEGREGESPLHQACAALSLKAVRMLLDAGADPNAQDAKGWTPLRHALRKNGQRAKKAGAEVIALLIERGADIALLDKKGMTAAQSAAATAPLGALAGLLAERPEDLAAGAAAKEARKKLSRRGGQGTALVEQAELNATLREAAASAATAKANMAAEAESGADASGSGETGSAGSGSTEGSAGGSGSGDGGAARRRTRL